MWLAHHEHADEARGVRVGTLGTDQRHQGSPVNLPDDPTAAVASRACVPPIDITLPQRPQARPYELMTNLREHARTQARRWADWPQVTWYVDDTPVAASVWYFAGAWAAFITQLEQVALVLIGIDTEPDGLRLVPVGHRSDYGVDLTAPLDKRIPGADTRERHLTSFSTLNQEHTHPDQRPFLPAGD